MGGKTILYVFCLDDKWAVILEVVFQDESHFEIL